MANKGPRPGEDDRDDDWGDDRSDSGATSGNGGAGEESGGEEGSEGGPGEGPRRPPTEAPTEPIPIQPNAEDIVEFDDVAYATVTAAQPGGAGFDKVDLVATREPSNLVRRYLFATEKFRGEWRRHWMSIVRRLTVGILLTFIIGFLFGYFVRVGVEIALPILVLVWVLVLGWVLWRATEWYYDRFVLTNKRVMLITGVIKRDVAMMPLNRVTDMRYTQSPLGRVFNYGQFVLESAGQEQALRTISYLPNPTDMYRQLVEEMYEPEASEARRRPAKVDDAA